MTGQGSYEVDVEAMKAGATDYLNKGEVSAPLLERTIRYAIERKRAEEAIRKNADRSELLATLSHTFAEAGLYYPAVLSTISNQIAEWMGDACVIRLLSDDNLWLDPVAFYHPDPEKLAIIRKQLSSARLKADSEPYSKALSTGKPLLIRAERMSLPLASEPITELSNGMPEKGFFRCALLVPLRVKDRMIGTLSLLRSHPNLSFSDEDKLFFQELADRAALSIENARLYLAEAERVRELDALHTAAGELLSTIDLKTLLSRILDIAQDAIPASDRGLLHLSVPDTGELSSLMASTALDPRIKKLHFSISNPVIIQRVRNHLPLLIQDTSSQAKSLPFELPVDLGSFRSAVIAPLILEDQFLGLLSLTTERPAAFSEADQRLLISFAHTTTAALQNAMLHAEVQKLAMTDSLTEVLNRRGFSEFGRREIERAMRFGRSLSAILVDIDHFKNINDTYGHAVGDQVLRIVSERLRASVREVDILGRYGGDEFVILLPETDELTASIAAERIRTRLMEPIAINGLQLDSSGDSPYLTISASLGVADLHKSAQDLPALLSLADAAAYSAKQSGRNRVGIGMRERKTPE
jgi:diguanylate cyclase (GGDEF)-like protein